jgi:uncharacterized DUF497 family protein
MEFEWDPLKADKNRQKHGVSFHEAGTVLADDLSITYRTHRSHPIQSPARSFKPAHLPAVSFR